MHEEPMPHRIRTLLSPACLLVALTATIVSAAD
jgi:hypothetical protein